MIPRRSYDDDDDDFGVARLAGYRREGSLGLGALMRDYPRAFLFLPRKGRHVDYACRWCWALGGYKSMLAIG
jgi:hypothetical protein